MGMMRLSLQQVSSSLVNVLIQSPSIVIEAQTSERFDQAFTLYR